MLVVIILVRLIAALLDDSCLSVNRSGLPGHHKHVQYLPKTSNNSEKGYHCVSFWGPGTRDIDTLQD